MKEQLTETLFEKIGGMTAVDAAVEIFYTKVLADDSISHFFRWTHMKDQNEKQKRFLAYAFGGPVEYSGKNMRDAHAHLVRMGLNETHFDAVMKHLVDTLRDLSISEDLIAEAEKIAENSREHVLGRSFK